ncbi:hypothetical protein [Granulicoccus phenolivorans]|uniref:hypothetical protein n=1 Tax=Granulicoccus phenolivorans TaxID=266854 RepID=UPI0005524927|nr:hypothetical protein [Granulicoccus phenolivorans]
MPTFTGRRVWLLDPRPEDISIADIAHALSQQCRYNGHTRVLLSVAEHCVLVSELVAPENALWGLLHDAAEAYVGDLIRPLKQQLPDFIRIEARVLRAITERFGLDPVMPPEVAAVDTRILLDERAALFDEPPDGRIPGERCGVRIRAWDPPTAERQYLRRFHELTAPAAEASPCVPG